MKKLLAILLAAMLLLTACAVAEAGGQVVINDLVVYMNEGQSLDLSGIDFVLAAAGNGSEAGVRVAVEANGSSVANAIASLGAEQLELRVDGLSDVYSIRYEDLIAMIERETGETGLLEKLQSGLSGMSNGAQALADVQAAIGVVVQNLYGIATPAGTEDIDGVEFEAYDLSISEETMAEMIYAWIDVLDSYAQQGLEGTGYDSYRQMFDEADLHMSVDGKIYEAAEEIIASIDVNAFVAGETEPETLNIYVDYTEDMEEETSEYYVVFSGVDGEEEEELVTLLATYTKADGEFGEFDLGIYGPYSNESDFYVSVCAPAAQDEGLWEFYVSIENDGDPVNCYLDFGSMNGQDQFYAHMIADEQTLSIDYTGADGVGMLSASIMDGEESVGGVNATIELAADDGAWLPGAAAQSVDLLTVDDAQMQKVSSEGMALMLNAMYSLSQANDSLAALMGSMMG